MDKIFEEGLRQAAAVIVVLSANSVGKPWVREEINAGFIKRFNSGSETDSRSLRRLPGSPKRWHRRCGSTLKTLIHMTIVSSDSRGSIRSEDKPALGSFLAM